METFTGVSPFPPMREWESVGECPLHLYGQRDQRGDNTYVGAVIRQGGMLFRFDIAPDSPHLSEWEDITVGFGRAADRLSKSTALVTRGGRQGAISWPDVIHRCPNGDFEAAGERDAERLGRKTITPVEVVMVTNWTDLVLDASPVQAIFGPRPPALEAVDLHEIVLHRDVRAFLCGSTCMNSRSILQRSGLLVGSIRCRFD